MTPTLKEAIEILTRYEKDYTVRIEPDFDDAIKLLIEAGKAVKYVRRNYPKILAALLPGETKEQERR